MSGYRNTMPSSIWLCGLSLIALPFISPPAHAQREYILLARQVGIPATQGLSMLIAHELTHVALQSQCRHAAKVIIFDITDPATPVEAGDPIQLSLAAGQAVSIPEITPMRTGTPGSGAGISQSIFDIWVVSDGPPAASCGNLAVDVHGWDVATKKTVFQATWSKPAPPPAAVAEGPFKERGFAFLELGSGQAGRAILTDWTNHNDSDPGITLASLCDFSGEIVAETVPVLDSQDSTVPAPHFRQAFPVKWEGPSTQSKRMTRSAIIDFRPDTPPGSRSKMKLTLVFNSTQPAACLDQLSGTLQVVEASTSETTTSTQVLYPRYRPQFYIR
jgi:hypothetical protein